MVLDDRSLDEVFKLFDLIHMITTDHQTVTRITREVRKIKHSLTLVLAFGFRLKTWLIFSFDKVVQDFALENVVYLELRTTPKVTQSY